MGDGTAKPVGLSLAQPADGHSRESYLDDLTSTNRDSGLSKFWIGWNRFWFAFLLAEPPYMALIFGKKAVFGEMILRCAFLVAGLSIFGDILRTSMVFPPVWSLSRLWFELGLL